MRARFLLLALAAAAGCSRQFWREQADAETYPIIAERVVSPAYDVGRTRVEPPPGSRLHDPFDPDRPPKPPDDPSAALFMDRPGGLKGSKHWGKDGHTDQIEGPGWEAALGLDEKGTLRLTQDRAVEIALLNSREYQTAVENVYLQALALTLNRFEFDVRWFGRNTVAYEHRGFSSVPTESNTLTVDPSFGFARDFAAGGQLLVDFANSLVYQYNDNSHTVGSNVAVTLTQPLLRNFGRKVRLEDLTQAERDTLYAVRDFARFRKGFWAQVAVGAGGASAGSVGVTGFGGFGGRFGGGGFGGGGGGYLDLLLTLQQLRNSQANLKRQEETYRLYNELFRGGRASVVELDQFFQSLQTARLDVIQAEVQLQTDLDQFKLQLGLPPRLPVELDDSLLNQFVLNDPELEKLRDAVEAFQRDRLRELDDPPPAADLRTHFGTLRGLADRIPKAVEAVAAELDRWAARLARPARPADDPEQRDRAKTTQAEMRVQLGAVLTEHRKLAAAIADHLKLVADANRKTSWEALAEDTKTAVALVDSVLAVQAQARIYLIDLTEVEATEAEAVAYAKANRLDLQNQLGQMTDAWRKVTVAANQLRADLDVVATANLATDPDRNNPVNFAADTSRYTVALRFDGPLNRQAERNAYRASLITYQRAKRDYVELSDSIEFSIRDDLRNLTLLRASFEISRQQLLSAARQYENARLILLGPQNQRQGNDTTTLNLLRALDTLLAARNALARSYINYEQARVQLLLDLEAVQLDQRGFPTNVPSSGPPRAGGDDRHPDPPGPPAAPAAAPGP